MAMPNVGDLIATTIESRARSLADNITKNTALLTRMNQRGRIRTVSGGRSITQEHSFSEVDNFMYYSGFETLNIAVNDTMTYADFPWKQAAVAVSVSGLEGDVQNAGREQMIDLVAGRMEIAEQTMTNNIGRDLYSDGTGSAGKQITGLQAAVADAPATGVYGGIDRANWPYWRNKVFSGASDGGAAVSASNIQLYMNNLYNQLARNMERADLIPCDNNYYGFYEASLQPQQRFRESSLATLGFEALRYKNADVVLDGGDGGGCPANHMYFLNTNYIFYRPHSGRNMVPLRGERLAVNQDAWTRLIGFAGNLTSSGPGRCGVLIA